MRLHPWDKPAILLSVLDHRCLVGIHTVAPYWARITFRLSVDIISESKSGWALVCARLLDRRRSYLMVTSGRNDGNLILITSVLLLSLPPRDYLLRILPRGSFQRGDDGRNFFRGRGLLRPR